MANTGANILLITSDQQHWNTLGFLNPEIETPNLDRLAAQGTVFDRAYCVNPTCTPTRASIITGLYPSQHGAWSLGTKLPENAPTVGDAFTRAGWRTALVGKAHFQPLRGTDEYPSLESYPILQDLAYWRNFHGPFYGFERVELARNHVDEAHVGQHYAIWMEEKGLANWRDYFRPPTGNNASQRHKWLIPEEFHYDAWIAERTNALLEHYAYEGRRFFLWSSFFDPHPPYLAPEPWDAYYDPKRITVPALTEGEHADSPPYFRKLFEEEPDFSEYQEPDGSGIHGFASHLQDPDERARDVAVYYGMITLMDKYIGRILDKVGALGLSENTLVVFTTDHGHFFGQHGLDEKGPFHYEDMIRVPFIARGPGVPAARRTNALLSLVDLAPTFLAVAGLSVPRTMTGVDQSGVILGRVESVRDHVLVENRHQPTTVFLRTYVDERYKITVHFQREYGEIYDLKEDPGELRNLWDRPERRALKTDLLQKMIYAEMGKEPLWMPRVAGA